MTPPRVLKQVKPRYPADAKRKRIVGTVIVEAIVSAEGDVRHAVVMSGHPMLNDAAIDAVLQWRFARRLLTASRPRSSSG